MSKTDPRNLVGEVVLFGNWCHFRELGILAEILHLFYGETILCDKA